MNCPNCGAPNDGGKFCKSCGTPLPQVQSNVQQNNSYQQSYQQPVQQPTYQQPNQYTPPVQPEIDPNEKTAKGFAVTSLVLGILSLICCGVVLSIPGVIFGIVSLNKKKEQNGMAIAGIVLSAIGLVASIIIIIVSAVNGGFQAYYHLS